MAFHHPGAESSRQVPPAGLAQILSSEDDKCGFPARTILHLPSIAISFRSFLWLFEDK